MNKLYTFYDGFALVASSPETFVEGMKASAIVFPQSKTLPEYMQGVARRLSHMFNSNHMAPAAEAWTVAPIVDPTTTQTFVDSLSTAGLLSITDVN